MLIASRPAGTSCCASCRASFPSSTHPSACRQGLPAVAGRMPLPLVHCAPAGLTEPPPGCVFPSSRPLLTALPQSHPLHPPQPNMTGPEQADAEAPTQANTGLRQLSHVWQMELWRNISEVTTWAPPHLEHVRGSDGVQFRWGWGHMCWVVPQIVGVRQGGRHGRQ